MRVWYHRTPTRAGRGRDDGATQDTTLRRCSITGSGTVALSLRARERTSQRLLVLRLWSRHEGQRRALLRDEAAGLGHEGGRRTPGRRQRRRRRRQEGLRQAEQGSRDQRQQRERARHVLDGGAFQ